MDIHDNFEAHHSQPHSRIIGDALLHHRIHIFDGGINHRFGEQVIFAQHRHHAFRDHIFIGQNLLLQPVHHLPVNGLGFHMAFKIVIGDDIMCLPAEICHFDRFAVFGVNQRFKQCFGVWFFAHRCSEQFSSPIV